MRFFGLMSTSLYKYSVSSIRASEAGLAGFRDGSEGVVYGFGGVRGSCK